MSQKEKVYDAFAKLIYAVVMADGEIKEPEKTVIANVVREHPIKEHLQKYVLGRNKNISLAQSFIHTLDICKGHGHDEEYVFLIKIIEEIAKVSEGLENQEDGMLNQFILNFKRRFSLS